MSKLERSSDTRLVISIKSPDVPVIRVGLQAERSNLVKDEHLLNMPDMIETLLTSKFLTFKDVSDVHLANMFPMLRTLEVSKLLMSRSCNEEHFENMLSSDVASDVLRY